MLRYLTIISMENIRPRQISVLELVDINNGGESDVDPKSNALALTGIIGIEIAIYCLSTGVSIKLCACSTCLKA